MIRMINNRSYDTMTGRDGLIFNRRTRWISENRFARWRESIQMIWNACRNGHVLSNWRELYL